MIQIGTERHQEEKKNLAISWKDIVGRHKRRKTLQNLEKTLWEDRREWRLCVHQPIWNRNAAIRCLLIHLGSLFIFIMFQSLHASNSHTCLPPDIKYPSVTNYSVLSIPHKIKALWEKEAWPFTFKQWKWWSDAS